MRFYASSIMRLYDLGQLWDDLILCITMLLLSNDHREMCTYESFEVPVNDLVIVVHDVELIGASWG